MQLAPLGNKFYTVGNPVYFAFKWWHIVRNMHLRDEHVD